MLNSRAETENGLKAFGREDTTAGKKARRSFPDETRRAGLVPTFSDPNRAGVGARRDPTAPDRLELPGPFRFLKSPAARTGNRPKTQHPRRVLESPDLGRARRRVTRAPRRTGRVSRRAQHDAPA